MASKASVLVLYRDPELAALRVPPARLLVVTDGERRPLRLALRAPHDPALRFDNRVPADEHGQGRDRHLATVIAVPADHHHPSALVVTQRAAGIDGKGHGSMALRSILDVHTVPPATPLSQGARDESTLRTTTEPAPARVRLEGLPSAAA